STSRLSRASHRAPPGRPARGLSSVRGTCGGLVPPAAANRSRSEHNPRRERDHRAKGSGGIRRWGEVEGTVECGHREGAMRDAIKLSEAHLALLRRNFDGEYVKVTNHNRALYQELVVAGLMEPLHTFALGPNSACRLTQTACDL